MKIGRQRLRTHITATHEHGTIGRLLLDNGAIKRLRQKYRLCFPLGPCKVVIREANSEAGSCRTIVQLSAGDTHGKFVVEEELEFSL
jgi:hypothetical protein